MLKTSRQRALMTVLMMLLHAGATPLGALSCNASIPLAALGCNACDVNASLTGGGCAAGEQCWPTATGSCIGTCIECLKGMYCPNGTINPYASSIATLCPEGFTCHDPALPLELCPAGHFCATATSDDGITCREATITNNFPRLYCEEGSKNYSICPGGYFCPNTTTKIQCAAGTFCAQGTNTTYECLSEWFQSAESRCPPGSSREPARYDSIVITILGIVTLILVVESIVWCAAKFQEKQRERKRQDSENSFPIMESIRASCSMSRSCDSNESLKSPASTQASASMVDAAFKSIFNPGAELLHLEVKDMSFKIGKATVLSRLNAEFYQGELCGLMGESGSGKTTLLNVLGGRALYGQVLGRVNLNGRRHEPESIKLGYVPQAYLIFKELTVWENLWYTARHRVWLKAAPTETINALVATVLELLGLTEVPSHLLESRGFSSTYCGRLGVTSAKREHARCMRTSSRCTITSSPDSSDYAQVAHVVCDKSIGTHRLSGGQLRRVGIGVELVALPTVLLLDEPTSALDAVNTQLIMQVLQSLAARGVLVVASLHQPRFTVYELLERLLVLRAGELIYAGKRSYTLDYLDAIGFVPAPQENPADFFIEVAFGLVQSSKCVTAAQMAEIWRKEMPNDHERKFTASRSPAASCSFDEFEEWFETEYGLTGEKLAYKVWERASAVVELLSHPNLSKAMTSFYSVKRVSNSTSHKRVFSPTTVHHATLVTKSKRSDKIFRATLPWDVLQQVIEEWHVSEDVVPSARTQFAISFVRYTIKLTRTRQLLYSRFVLVALLGILCGMMTGTNPEEHLEPVFVMLSLSLFCTVVSCTTISSLGNGELERDFFAHEQSCGIRQHTEAVARMILDLLPIVACSIFFAIPILGLTASRVQFSSYWMILLGQAWAYSSLGYLFGVRFPSSATVFTVAVCLVSSTFFTGNFGVRVSALSENPGIHPGADGYGFFTMVPAFWGYFMAKMELRLSLPFSTRHDYITRNLRLSGYLPEEENWNVLEYDDRRVDWYATGLTCMLIFGFIFRVLALLYFVFRNFSRKNYKDLLSAPVVYAQRAVFSRRVTRLIRGTIAGASTAMERAHDVAVAIASVPSSHCTHDTAGSHG